MNHKRSKVCENNINANTTRKVHQNQPQNKSNLQLIYETTFNPPSFTVKELREAVPAHLFRRSLLKSSTYLIINLIFTAYLFYAASFIRPLLHNNSSLNILEWIGWGIYWWFQGISLTGIWVIAHECGHQAFSDSRFINNTTGFILHSLLLVPYFSWKITHAQHHAYAAHIEKDQGFVPKRRSNARPKPHSEFREAIQSSPIYIVSCVFVYLLFGWPAYLIANVSGRKYKRITSHFLPASPFFDKKHRGKVIISNIGLLVVIILYTIIIWNSSVESFCKFCFIPYLVVNGWIVTITFLQHTDTKIPKYTNTTWDWVRGSLATVDRDYGWFLNITLHHIQDSHVAHHLFPTMPFYHAIQATPYLKDKLGDYYVVNNTPILKALYQG